MFNFTFHSHLSHDNWIWSKVSEKRREGKVVKYTVSIADLVELNDSA